ncbi:MAG: diguanylate cyclase [Betaproteobacteria bacterium]|nr:diguanylate cyclase [Betaproteobacteria bacterium]
MGSDSRPDIDSAAQASAAETTLNALPSAVLRFSLDGRINLLNPAAERMLGIGQGGAIAQPLADILQVIAHEDRSPLLPDLLQDLRQGNLAGLGEQACLVTQEGLELEVEGQAAPIFAADGRAVEGVLVMRDVTEAREQQRKQAWLAEHDALTGAMNRKAFEDRLARVVNSKRASEYPMTLIVVGVDSYDAVRGREGQSAGNELLIQVVRLLQNRLRDTDSIGRLDEAQIGITLAACPNDIAERIARTLHDSLSQHKLHWGKDEYPVDISMGVVHIPPNWETLDRVMSAGQAACAQSRADRAIAIHAN